MKKMRRCVGFVVLTLLLLAVSAVVLQPDDVVAAPGDDVIMEGVYMGDIICRGIKDKAYYLWRGE